MTERCLFCNDPIVPLVSASGRVECPHCGVYLRDAGDPPRCSRKGNPMNHPTSLMVCADGVEVRTFNVLPDGSDLSDQLVAASDLCHLFGEDGATVVSIVPQFDAPAQPAYADTIYTVVLIDRDPEHAEDGDFIEVVGVTVDDLTNPDRMTWLQPLAETMAERVARDAGVHDG
jgi:hypothetical protein